MPARHRRRGNGDIHTIIPTDYNLRLDKFELPGGGGSLGIEDEFNCA
jgi:hypothetical protein